MSSSASGHVMAWHGTAWHGMARHGMAWRVYHGNLHRWLQPFKRSISSQSRLSSGAGRGGNRWESPGGCLMFTAVKRLAIPGQRLPFVQYIVSLAVAQAVQAEAAARLQVRSGAGFACTLWHLHEHGAAWAWRGMPSNAVAMPRHMSWLGTPPMARLSPARPPAPAVPLRRASPSMCVLSGPTTCMPAP